MDPSWPGPCDQRGMPLLLLLLGIFAPRVVIIVLALFTEVMHTAYDGLLLPLVGFLILPLTTLTYAAAIHFSGGVEGTMWLVFMVVAVLIDLGSAGWHARRRRAA